VTDESDSPKPMHRVSATAGVPFESLAGVSVSATVFFETLAADPPCNGDGRALTPGSTKSWCDG
jgi:hypothetical protein